MSLILIVGYVVVGIFEYKSNIISSSLGFIHLGITDYGDTGKLIRYYEQQELFSVLFLGIVLGGAFTSGFFAAYSGRSVIFWFLFGLFANFSTLFLLGRK
ncbi:MAG: hypothetical protein GY820_09495 [Gammaproteobacteria bacterium]|nr:hypothetical protein [Gammaproteobacteria bacterium]